MLVNKEKEIIDWMKIFFAWRRLFSLRCQWIVTISKLSTMGKRSGMGPSVFSVI